MLEASSCSFSSEKLRRMLSDSSINSIDTSLNSRIHTPPVMPPEPCGAVGNSRDTPREADAGDIRSDPEMCKGFAVGCARRQDERQRTIEVAPSRPAARKL